MCAVARARAIPLNSRASSGDKLYVKADLPGIAPAKRRREELIVMKAKELITRHVEDHR